MPNSSGYMVPVENGRPAIIQPIDLGQAGLSYATAALRASGPVSLLVDRLFADKTSCFAPLEQGVALERAQQFKTGTFMPTMAIRKWLADDITSCWGADSQLVFADPWMKQSDFQIRPPRQLYFSIAETPYHFPQNGDVYNRLTEGAQATHSWDFVVYVISPSVPLPQPGASMASSYAESLAQHTQAVLVSAYDHEGFVVCQKNS